MRPNLFLSGCENPAAASPEHAPRSFPAHDDDDDCEREKKPRSGRPEKLTYTGLGGRPARYVFMAL